MDRDDETRFIHPKHPELYGWLAKIIGIIFWEYGDGFQDSDYSGIYHHSNCFHCKTITILSLSQYSLRNVVRFNYFSKYIQEEKLLSFSLYWIYYIAIFTITYILHETGSFFCSLECNKTITFWHSSPVTNNFSCLHISISCKVKEISWYESLLWHEV